ncbi:type III secretion system cytoplasmic ring protein SctQ [Comamonas endophytica]|uniref:type III secretion system cytoplasmic ring protein SctQ n=1 Tax=Comamonas endophytica TaxID=2949090 RepID=UPI00361EFBC7
MSSSLSAPFLSALPQLSRNEAQARTTIAQRAREMPVRCGGTQWLASLRPVIQSPWPAVAGDTVADIEWAGAQLQLQLPEAAADQMLSALLEGAALAQLPGEMQAAALSAALSELMDRLEQLGRGTPQIRGIVREPMAAALPHAFALRLDAVNGTQSIAGLLRTDSLGLLLIAGLASALPPHAGPLANDSLPLTLRLDIGYATVSVQELQQLGLGDVLPMERSLVSAERVLWLQAPGAGGLHVHLPAMPAETAATEVFPDDAQSLEPAREARAAPFLTVVQPWTPAMPTPENPPADAAGFDAIPVRLSFDLGEISLALAEVRALQPGQAIRLEHPVASAVRIRANGALIGEGELVEIDGQLGVSISRLFAPKPAP